MKFDSSFHHAIPMEARVVIPAGLHTNNAQSGTVIGIASMHIIIHYIVLLDEPLITEYGTMRAVAVQGTLLTAADGSHWRT